MKWILILILIILVSPIYADMYSNYLDSLETAFSEGKTEQMLNLSNLIIDIDSSRAEGFYYKSYAYYINGIYDNALNIIESAISREDDIESRYLRLLIMDKINHPDYSTYLNKVYAENCSEIRLKELKSAYFYSINKMDSSLYYALNTIKGDPKHEYALYRAGVIFYNNKNYEKAEKILAQLVKYYNKNPYMMLLGKTYSKNKKYSAASSVFNSLIETSLNYRAYSNLSYTLYQSGKTDSCVSALMRMRQIYPDSVFIYQNMISIEQATGNSLILDTFDMHRELIFTFNDNIIEQIADAMFRHDYYERANAYYNELSLNENFTSRTSVQSYFFDGQYDKSLEMLSRMPSDSDTAMMIFINSFIGSNYYKLGNYFEAEMYFKNAYELNPLDTMMAFNLANTYYLNRKDLILRSFLDSLALISKSFSDKMIYNFFPEIIDSTAVQ